MRPSCKFSEEFLQCPRILSVGFIQRPKLARLARIDQPCFVPERIRFQTAFLIPIYLTSNIPIDHRIDNRSIFFQSMSYMSYVMMIPLDWKIAYTYIHIIYICTCMHIHNYTTHIYMYILYIYICLYIYLFTHVMYCISYMEASSSLAANQPAIVVNFRTCCGGRDDKTECGISFFLGVFGLYTTVRRCTIWLT